MEITEINGTLNKYYFKWSTKKCKAFGMIERNNSKNDFILTKDHNIEYFNHSYCKNKICIKKLFNNEITKEEWNLENIICSLFKYYFIQNSESND